jgi:hypothetical protein
MEPQVPINCPITDCPRCKEIVHTCDLKYNYMDCSHAQYKMKGKKKNNEQGAGTGFENSL